jgi:hypothetical protein
VIAAGVALCLFIFQGLVVAMGANFAKAPASGVAMAVASCGAHDDEGAPAPARHDHSDCLMNCCETGRGGAEFFALAAKLCASVSIPARSEVFSSLSPLEALPPTRPDGWASSWSSRAPPRLA